MKQISQSLGKESIGLLDGVVPGNEVVPRGRLRTGGGEDIKEVSPVGEPNGLATARGTGVTEACFFIEIKGRPLGEGSSRLPSRSGRGSRVLAGERGSKVQAGGGSVAVTEQCDENQGGGCRKD